MLNSILNAINMRSMFSRPGLSRFLRFYDAKSVAENAQFDLNSYGIRQHPRSGTEFRVRIAEAESKMSKSLELAREAGAILMYCRKEDK